MIDAVDNLLNGAIGSIVGSIVGVIGAYYLAVHTIRRALINDRIQAREMLAVEAAGTIAVSLVNLYDILGDLLASNTDLKDSDIVRIDSKLTETLDDSVREVSRDITISGTLLPSKLSSDANEARKVMRQALGRPGMRQITKKELLEVRKVIRDAGDSLRDFRRKAYS